MIYEKKYLLDDFDDFFTGKDHEGKMVICGILYPFLTAILFDEEGRFLRVERRELEGLEFVNGIYVQQRRNDDEDDLEEFIKDLNLTQCRICIHKFFLKEEKIGIEDLPYHLKIESIDIGDNLNEREEDMKDWIDGGYFVFNWDKDYHIDSEGTVVSS